MYDYIRRVDSLNNNTNLIDLTLQSMGAMISASDSMRLRRYRELWNFYEGFHWEGVGDTDKPQITENYCRPFVNKFVSFELGRGFNIKMHPDVEQDVLPYLNFVWDDNSKEIFVRQLGQTKAVTGDSWVQVLFIPKFVDAEGKYINPMFDDPFDEYDKGRIRVLVVPPNIVFPEYEDGYDKDKLKRVVIMYPIKLEPENPNSTKMIIYKQIWDKQKCEVFKGQELIGTYPNKYGIIPFVHIKNFELAGRVNGVSDLEDLIPMNMELNLKKSDVSEIIDYHSAPVTCVFGARIGQLEKGANKVWGGLPKDAKVENLELNSDMSASNSYIGGVKTAMHEIGSVPESALGKEVAISNTSGVALQMMLSPLIEKVSDKQALSRTGLQTINKIILKIGLIEGLVSKKEEISNRDFYQNTIIFEDALPKDRLVEMQEIQLEMKQGLCDRQEAMERLGKKDISERLERIDADRKANPTIYGLELDPITGNLVVAGSTKKDVMTRPAGENKAGNPSQVNAGFTNSPKKQVNTNS